MYICVYIYIYIYTLRYYIRIKTMLSHFVTTTGPAVPQTGPRNYDEQLTWRRCSLCLLLRLSVALGSMELMEVTKAVAEVHQRVCTCTNHLEPQDIPEHIHWGLMDRFFRRMPTRQSTADYFHRDFPYQNISYEDFTRLAETRLAQNTIKKWCKVI